ncbi:ParB/RepB/Spo0J family partition protein [Promineifilum sp.]|uniref:ParB/RepB/Spo0J family partition protein n=1 Tax=Promineifilum sp. TaxID=2664178 RepID=UPI0035B3EBC0
MARKKAQINLAQSIQPRGGDFDRLFTTEADAEQAAGLQLLAVRLDAIDADPDQPRSTFNEDALRELSESIRQDGVIQPIEVTQSSAGRYLIVHGERRWRAAQLAGLETIPAVVRRRDYDEVTRFVRQVVENIQREDLNDVDRAAALLRLRKLMQEEVDAARRDRGRTADAPKDEPWSGKVTWAKVGGRLGYSRQRIHQLIQLLDLPDEIKDAVRDGVLSERDTRVYQGLTAVQQRALHRARLADALDAGEVRQIARLLREAPDLTVTHATRLLRQAAQEAADDRPPAADSSISPAPLLPRSPAGEEPAPPSTDTLPDPLYPTRLGRPTSIERLDWVRGHLARIDRQGLTAAERKEILRLLKLIQDDVASLMAALREN